MQLGATAAKLAQGCTCLSSLATTINSSMGMIRRENAAVANSLHEQLLFSAQAKVKAEELQVGLRPLCCHVMSAFKGFSCAMVVDLYRFQSLLTVSTSMCLRHGWPTEY